jgi:hypothetical protein
LNQISALIETLAVAQYGEGMPEPSPAVIILPKAGKPGWASIVPIYNIIVWLQVVNRPIWWILLLFIPIVGFIVAIILTNDLAKAFGKGVGWTIGLLFLPMVFLPILGFGDDEYVGRPS